MAPPDQCVVWYFDVQEAGNLDESSSVKMTVGDTVSESGNVSPSRLANVATRTVYSHIRNPGQKSTF